MENIDFKNIIEPSCHSERSESGDAESVKLKPTEGSHNVISSQLDGKAGEVEESFSSNVISSAVERSLLIDQETRNTHINIGTGKEISIKELAETIKATIGYEGKLYFNSEKPDGTMRKLTDASKLNKLGWKYKVELEEGIKKMYEWYINSN